TETNRPDRYATNGNRNAVKVGFGTASRRFSPLRQKRPFWNGEVGKTSSRRLNHVKRLTPSRQAWYTASLTQRAWRSSGAVSEFASGGRVSQANSVIQNCGGRRELTCPARTAGCSRRCMAGRSPGETSPA